MPSNRSIARARIKMDDASILPVVLTMPKEPASCEYLLENRLCRAVIEQDEGNSARREFCKNAPKNYCCYLCGDHENCEIGCSYLDEKVEPARLDRDIASKIKQQIRKYEEEKGKLASLLANGKIGEQSFSAATKTLDTKIEELKKAGESPSLEEIKTAIDQNIEIEDTEDGATKPTSLRYLVPFFFGILGGIVGYVAVKDEDKDMAQSLIIFGALMTLVLVLIFFTFWLYLFYWRF